ncbi:hypothetical protein D3C87_1730720 [compost metagenome]
MGKCLIQRAFGKAQSSCRDGSAKNVEGAHGDLETFAGGAEQARRRNAAIVETDRCQRMRGDHVDTLGYREAGIIGKDNESGNATRARRFAGAGKDRVDIGNAAV